MLSQVEAFMGFFSGIELNGLPLARFSLGLIRLRRMREREG
jgi:hypothetical protein